MITIKLSKYPAGVLQKYAMQMAAGINYRDDGNVSAQLTYQTLKESINEAKMLLGLPKNDETPPNIVHIIDIFPCEIIENDAEMSITINSLDPEANSVLILSVPNEKKESY